MTMINHDEAIALEFSVRKVFDCERFGVMGIANADHLERYPMDAALVVFAPLYKEQAEIPEIDEFMDKYGCIFHFPDSYTYDKNTVREYIDELRTLIDKYCN